jgi:uncharacterized protein involved in type VI secretion and phage assembly
VNYFRGVVPGIVKSVKDPDGMGRIQVHFPRLAGDNRSFWASVAAPMAGGKRGFFFQPEPEDEVLVAFEDGQPEHPYIVGFLWNGVDLPPESDPQNRVLLTPGGHKVRFEDAAGKRKIVIESSGGLRVTLDDTDQSIQLHGGGRVLAMKNNQVRIT